jgi:hypothetical protein
MRLQPQRAGGDGRIDAGLLPPSGFVATAMDLTMVTAAVSLPTVKRVEAGTGPRVSDAARNKLRRTFESVGVKFIDENGGGPGVRLRKRQSKKG